MSGTSPAEVESGSLSWRREAFDQLARICLGGFVVAMFIAGFEDARSGALLAVPLACIGALLAGWAWFSKKTSLDSRVFAIFLAFWLVCTTLVVLFGTLGPVPFVGLSLAVILVSVLSPERTWQAFALVLLSLVIVGGAYVSLGWLPHGAGEIVGVASAPTVRFDPRLASTWVRDVGLFAFLTLVSVRTIGAIQRRIEEALVVERDLHSQLMEETAGKLVAMEERALLVQQIDEMERVDSLGRLAAGVAHDFNNLIAVILTNVEVARDLADSSIHEDLDDIQEAGLRATELVTQLMAFTEQPDDRVSAVLLDERVLGAIKLVDRLLPAHIDLSWRLDGQGQQFVGKPSSIAQLVMNLCVNARDCMPDGGRIEVSTSVVERPATPGEAPMLWMCLAVRDEGAGFSDELLGKILQPHPPTKMEAGRGLGLLLVSEFADDAGGFIEVNSTPGQGSECSVFLPVSSDGPEVEPGMPPRRERKEWSSEGSTVLLVDDDSMLLTGIERMLERAGYRVLAAQSGDQALDIHASCVGQIDLLVTDSMMPGMSGLDLYRAILRAERLPVLFCSGYTSDQFEDGFFEAPDRDWLRKPFLRSGLLDRINGLLSLRPAHVPGLEGEESEPQLYRTPNDKPHM